MKIAWPSKPPCTPSLISVEPPLIKTGAFSAERQSLQPSSPLFGQSPVWMLRKLGVFGLIFQNTPLPSPVTHAKRPAQKKSSPLSIAKILKAQDEEGATANWRVLRRLVVNDLLLVGVIAASQNYEQALQTMSERKITEQNFDECRYQKIKALAEDLLDGLQYDLIRQVDQLEDGAALHQIEQPTLMLKIALELLSMINSMLMVLPDEEMLLYQFELLAKIIDRLTPLAVGGLESLSSCEDTEWLLHHVLGLLFTIRESRSPEIALHQKANALVSNLLLLRQELFKAIKQNPPAYKEMQHAVLQHYLWGGQYVTPSKKIDVDRLGLLSHEMMRSLYFILVMCRRPQTKKAFTHDLIRLPLSLETKRAIDLLLPLVDRLYDMDTKIGSVLKVDGFKFELEVALAIQQLPQASIIEIGLIDEGTEIDLHALIDGQPCYIEIKTVLYLLEGGFKQQVRRQKMRAAERGCFYFVVFKRIARTAPEVFRFLQKEGVPMVFFDEPFEPFSTGLARVLARKLPAASTIP